ncbi:MAG: nucleotidyltransferase domain-containing protein [Planctomycetes bacterium]|nr:nucleotidyltransferase domain-containing protein [Planctomycetota bacterium]
MTEPRPDLGLLVDRLRQTFGSRLLYVGLQGSHRRGEATPVSDVDAVVVLDRLEPEDLAAYRRVVGTLPWADRACGFIGDAAVLRHWPRSELFQFRQDTEDLYGNLRNLLPPISRRDIRNGVGIAAGGIYHQIAHALVHGGNEVLAETVRGCLKTAFFLLQSVHFLQSGRYCDSKQALLAELAGRDRDILAAAMHTGETAAGLAMEPEGIDRLLLAWSRDLVVSGTAERDDDGVCDGSGGAARAD